MNENINLCELLKGHQGETFYSIPFGELLVTNVTNNHIELSNDWILSKDGKLYSDGECLIFPSKDQRDWNKWVEEQRPKTPKTWNELCKVPHISYELARRSITEERSVVWYKADTGSNPIEKSALALLKIHQLIEIAYGGNITNEEWKDNCWKHVIGSDRGKFFIRSTYSAVSPIAFHTEEQAKEFLFYPDNVQLLKDFYMI